MVVSLMIILADKHSKDCLHIDEQHTDASLMIRVFLIFALGDQQGSLLLHD